MADTEHAVPRTRGAPSEVEERVLALIPSLRRYTAVLVADVHDQQDVVQETLVRVLAVADRLAADALPGYALAVARNLVATRGRDNARFRAHAPRLAETGSPQQPDAAVLAAEERAALGEALSALPEEHRDVLVAHAVHGEPLSAIAGGSASGAMAAKLARTRARVRVDYVLALRGVRLPSERCRMVLLALSSGDRRRQDALDAGAHLLTCPVCRDVSVPLMTRKRALAAFLPLGAAPFAMPDLDFGTGGAAAGGPGSASGAEAAGGTTGAAGSGGGQSTAGGAGAGGAAGADGAAGAAGSAGTAVGAAQVVAASAAVAAVIGGLGAVSALTDSPTNVVSGVPVSRPAAPSAAPSTDPEPTSQAAPSADAAQASGGCLDRLPAGSLAPVAGRDVCLDSALVVSVPADEGFWIRTADGRDSWVAYRVGTESPPDIDAGQRVDVRGTLVRHGAEYAANAGVTPSEGAAALSRQGGHIASELSQVRVVG